MRNLKKLCKKKKAEFLLETVKEVLDPSGFPMTSVEGSEQEEHLLPLPHFSKIIMHT